MDTKVSPENKVANPKRWSDDPNSAKYHSRSASYKAKHKNKKNSKENYIK
jgi:hypothetical protein